MKILSHPIFGSVIPQGRITELPVPHPERTARKTGARWDAGYTFAEWPSRGAMLTTIRLQEQREPRATDWRPIVKN